MTLRQFSILFITAVIISCHSRHDQVAMLLPSPTQGTVVKEDMEEGQHRERREKWMSLLHQSAPSTDWKQVESDRAWEKHLSLKNTPLKIQGRSFPQSQIAQGKLLGVWDEKGSLNQSGSVIATAYDPEADLIYVVGAGGSLFSGDRDGNAWNVVNQSLRFGGSMLELIDHQGKKRMIGIVDRKPAFSDDMGWTWTPAQGWIDYSDSWGSIFHPVISNESGHIIALGKPSYWSNLSVLASSDGGENFREIRSLSSYDVNKYFLCSEQNSDRVILIDKVSSDLIDFYVYDPNTMSFEIESVSRTKGFGEEGRSNLVATRISDSVSWYYMFDKENVVHFSDDLGMSWEPRDTLDERPWGVGMFVSPSDPRLLLAGAVQCYRSEDGGKHFSMINKWQDYYGDVKNKLHADMMFFNEFKDSFGKEFLTISNHGGLNLSYDKAKTTPSISLQGLNVSQYYSVRTDPFYPDYLYAGSQDQGFQRGRNLQNGPLDFDQLISGDYGHIVFSSEGRNMWTVYPGGWVIYYDMPRDQRWPLLSYDLDSDDETVWIPPLAETVNTPEDDVWMAGGSIYGGPGSHLIRLYREGDRILADQFDHDFKQASGGGTISAIHQHAANPNVIYVATTNGKLFYTLDKGLSWAASIMQVPGGHYLYGASIVSPYSDPSVFYMGGSGYSNAPVVWSTTGGRIVRPFDDGLPPTTVFQLVMDPEEKFLFAATEAGPYVCVLDERKWYPMGDDLAPNQTFWSVEYLYPENIVRFGTYGRGIWDFKIEALNTSVQEQFEDLRWDIYPNPVADFLEIRINESVVEPLSAHLVDISGNKLAEWNKLSSGQQLDLRGYFPGTYWIVLNRGRQISTRKLIIQ